MPWECQLDKALFSNQLLYRFVLVTSLVAACVVTSIFALYGVHSMKGGSSAIYGDIRRSGEVVHEKYTYRNMMLLILSMAGRVIDYDSFGERMDFYGGSQIIERYRDEFRVSSVDISASSDQSLFGAYMGRGNLRFVYTDITINFRAVTDVDAVKFLEQVTKRFPGYVEVTSLSISKIRDIDKEYIVKSTELGRAIPTVEISGVLRWYDVLLGK